MNPQTNSNSKAPKIIFGLVILVLLAIVAYATNKKPVEPTFTITEDMSTTTDESILASLPKTILYTAKTDKETYAQNEKIVITISVVNNTAETKAFKFSNGCESTYEVNEFNLMEHTDCLPQPSTFTLEPAKTKQIRLTHYPDLYKIPVGKQTIKAEIIGYGTAETQVTITSGTNK